MRYVYIVESGLEPQAIIACATAKDAAAIIARRNRVDPYSSQYDQVRRVRLTAPRTAKMLKSRGQKSQRKPKRRSQ